MQGHSQSSTEMVSLTTLGSLSNDEENRLQLVNASEVHATGLSVKNNKSQQMLRAGSSKTTVAQPTSSAKAGPYAQTTPSAKGGPASKSVVAQPTPSANVGPSSSSAAARSTLSAKVGPSSKSMVAQPKTPANVGPSSTSSIAQCTPSASAFDNGGDFLHKCYCSPHIIHKRCWSQHDASSSHNFVLEH